MLARLSTIIDGPPNLDINFKAVISDLEALTDHDPNNLIWQRTLMRAYIDYYFHIEDADIQDSMKIKIKEMNTKLLTQLEDKNILEIFFAELIGGQGVSDSWWTVIPEGSEERAIISSELLRFNTESLEQEDVEKYAKIVIGYYQGNFNSIEHKAIQRLIEAHLVLGECGAASKKVIILKKRGYKAPNLSDCL